MLQRLYQSDAAGIRDEELIDEVGITLLVRCQDIRRVSERRCWACGGELLGERTRGATLTCSGCGWSVTWSRYQNSYKRKRVFGVRALPAVLAYLRDYPSSRTWAEKMMAVDRLIHSVHESIGPGVNPWVAPLAENLIEGTAQETFELLERLAAGEQSTQTLRDIRAAWDQKVEAYRARLLAGSKKTAFINGRAFDKHKESRRSATTDQNR